MHFANHYKKFQWKQSRRLVDARQSLSSRLSGLCTSGMMDPPPILRFYRVVCDNWPRGPAGYSEKFWGGCAPGFRNHTLGYTETDRGPKSYPWLWKMGQNQTLDNGKVTKLTTFEAILHEIDQIWPKSCHLLRKKWWNYVKNGKKLAENMSLAMEPQLKLDPWLWKSSQK